MEKRLSNEINHGRKIASQAGHVWNWESPAGRRRWQRRAELLTQRIAPSMAVLELGCGTGYYTAALARTGAAITAIDISPDLLEIARSKVSDPNVTFLRDNAYNMGFDDGRFDLVAGISVLHHLDVSQALKEIFRVLKPGGEMVFSEPNMLNPHIALEKNIPFIKKMLGDSPDETAFFRWKMGRQLKEAGFEEISVVPFDFLYPAVPKPLIPLCEGAGSLLETIPLLKEIAGSLSIHARKGAGAD